MRTLTKEYIDVCPHERVDCKVRELKPGTIIRKHHLFERKGEPGKVFVIDMSPIEAYEGPEVGEERFVGQPYDPAGEYVWYVEPGWKKNLLY